jgi:predicted porin
MNKKLIAAAIAGAFVAPAAFAQNSSVQIYGLLNAEYGFYNQPNTAVGGGRSNVDALNSGASRIGFRGTEKLGGGMTAFWQCESDIRFLGGGATNNGSLCDRNSAIGLRGGFGSFYVGTWDSPLKRVVGSVRILNETGWLGSQTMTINAGGAWPTQFSLRNAQSLNYDTPNFGGFSASFQTTTTNPGRHHNTTAVAPTPKGRLNSMSGQYVQGPLRAVLGFSKHDDNRSVGGQGQTDTAWAIGGTYDFGVVRLGMTYADIEIETGPGASTERKSWAIAADWRLGGPHMIRFGYNDAGDAKTNVGGGANTGAKLMQVGYHHALSKRTSASISYARMNNDSAGTYLFTNAGTGGGGGIQAGDDSSVLVFGLVHTF